MVWALLGRLPTTQQTEPLPLPMTLTTDIGSMPFVLKTGPLSLLTTVLQSPILVRMNLLTTQERLGRQASPQSRKCPSLLLSDSPRALEVFILPLGPIIIGQFILPTNPS